MSATTKARAAGSGSLAASRTLASTPLRRRDYSLPPLRVRHPSRRLCPGGARRQQRGGENERKYERGPDLHRHASPATVGRWDFRASGGGRQARLLCRDEGTTASAAVPEPMPPGSSRRWGSTPRRSRSSTRRTAPVGSVALRAPEPETTSLEPARSAASGRPERSRRFPC